MAAFDVDNPYFRNQVLTASPEKLRLLLLDGCLHFLADGRTGLAERDYERMYAGFSQARDIILELVSGIRTDAAPELCAQVQALYTFLFRHLTEAGFEKSLEKVDEVIRIVEYERDTWALLLEQLLAERERAAAPAGHDRAPRSGEGGPSLSLSA